MYYLSDDNNNYFYQNYNTFSLKSLLKGVRKVIGLILKRPRAVTVSFSLLRTPPF